GRRFTTYEKIEEIPFIVIKRNGARQTFNTSKILSGVNKACEKRPIPIELQHKVADDVVRELLSTIDDQEVESKVIGEYVMRHLKDLDEVAYVRFACVHRQFKDINTFMDELKVLLKEQDDI
ncbi:MAG: transcriptional repressor NrdR, partial [Clostridiales bacterium]|nr:transcriptional repressor NrdR [Clostridiales bacterium]